jgi:predicted MFS family arabinose efflux permease
MIAGNDVVTAKGEWRRGWPVVVSGACGFGTGVGLVIQVYGFFVRPMQRELGWSLQALSLAPLMHLSLALSGPICGWLVDRWGARRSFLSGLFMSALLLISLAAVPAVPVVFYVIAILLGSIGSLTSTVPTVRGVVSWFRATPGTAIGLAMNGTSVISLAAIPTLTTFIYYFGWRSGFLVLAGFILFVSLPIVFLFFRECTDEPCFDSRPAEAKGMDVKHAIRTARFWLVLAACSLGGFAVGGFISHLQPLLADRGFGLKEAGFLGVVYSISIIIGRTGGGFLLDRLRAELVALTLFLLAGTGALVVGMIDVNAPRLIVIMTVLLIGMGQGAEGDFVAFFTFKNFGIRRYSTLVGIINFSVGLSLSLGGFVFAALFDNRASYVLATQIGANCFAIAGVLIFLTRFARTTTNAWVLATRS